MYALFKTLHIIGVVILVGNVTITAFWKVFADRTGNAQLIAHAQPDLGTGEVSSPQLLSLAA
jgi:uncharacterized membrane protein